MQRHSGPLIVGALAGREAVMAEEANKPEQQKDDAVAVKAQPTKRHKPKRKPPKRLPPWKVLLHNDDKNELFFVVKTITELTPLDEQQAILRTLEAHETGVALLLTTHKERAELYMEQFESKGLTVTIESAE